MNAFRKLSAGLAIFITIILAIIVRFYLISTKPGWELDEVVYYKIVMNFIKTGYVWQTAGVPYMSHPPFYFVVTRALFSLFGEDLSQMRMTSGISQAISIGILVVFVKNIWGKREAFAAAVFLFFDAWLVYTGRVGWMENLQSIFIAIGVLGLWSAKKNPSLSNTSLAGFLIGMSIIFKHIGLFMLILVFLEWLLNGRRGTKHYVFIFAVALTILITYVVFNLSSINGELYYNQSVNQFKRMIGLTYSPGLNYGLVEAVQAITSRYWIFTTTILTLVLGIPYMLIKVLKRLNGSYMQDTILLSWSAAAVIFLGLISLKSPHYMMLMLMPLLLFLGVELSRILKPWQIKSFLVIFVAINCWASYQRYTYANDTLLVEVQRYFEAEVSVDATVYSIEAICAVIPQPCTSMIGNNSKDIAYISENVDLIVEYTSTTQKFPKVGSNYVRMETIYGFKDIAIIYKKSP